MNITATIKMIREALLDIDNKVDDWFDKPTNLREYKPKNGGWTINEILEHIALTSHFLLILIDKGVKKSTNKLSYSYIDLQCELSNYHFESDKLDEVGLHNSFKWMRPEHMNPTGTKDIGEVRKEIRNQFTQCVAHLDDMPIGQGIMHKTTMSVNNLGKIDVYQYIYFLAKHAERHITQMQKNKIEFLNSEL